MSSSLLRRLLLPIDPERESASVAVLTDYLEEIDVTPEDADSWVGSELLQWSSSGSPSPELQELVEALLARGADEEKWTISSYYFGLHDKLVSPKFGIDWAEARELLSHTRLIADLALKHRMTAARIARVLAQSADQAPRYSRALDPVLNALGSSRSLEASEVTALLETDRARALSVFGDSNMEEAAETLDEIAELLGVEVSIEEMLRALADDGETPFGPYLQILHFLLVSTEYYDHFLREAYEFSPRGVVAELLFDGHPVALKSGNPFLNNAKKVRVLNEVWAEGADDHLRAARALASLLEILDALAYPARRELSSNIRAWIAKVFDSFADSAVEVPETLSAPQIERLATSVATAPTATGGVIEQRLVDLYCVASHPAPRWIHVGIGDSVNTTNVSRRKCGDSEAIDSKTTSIVAYESHGGALSAKYVAEHQRTLARTLEARESDLVTRAQPGQWDIRVVFVAHSFAGELPKTASFDGGWTVSFAYLTFDQVRAALDEQVTYVVAAGLFTTHCLPALRSTRTPNRVRERVLALL